MKSNYDAPWKNLTEQFFEEFTAFFLPEAYREINWAKPVVNLNTELTPLSPRDKVKTRIADKLFRVCLNEGEPCVVLVHLEFQSQRDSDFAKRMVSYNFRISN